MWHMGVIALLFLMLSAPLVQAASTPTADFTDNGDGTVMHKTTGLTWKRCSEGQTWTGASCSGKESTYTWGDARGLSKGDWRLPTLAELLTIIERDNFNPAINSTIFPGTTSHAFWSSTGGGGDYLYYVDFYDGTKQHVVDIDTSMHTALPYQGTMRVRLVRVGQPGGTPSTPTSDFTDNGDGTVTHKTTGLTWKRCAEGQTWNGATCTGSATRYDSQEKAKAFTRIFAGKSDWRLPNVRELSTLTEVKASNPAINTVIFPETPPAYFWTASWASSGVWKVNFGDGASDIYNHASNATYYGWVRLVRGGQPLGLLDLNRPTTDYLDNGDGTTTHTPTGLTWKRCAEGQAWSGSACTGTATTYAWAAATALTGTYAGKSDWRLPTLSELRSLVDFTLFDESLNNTIFPYTRSGRFWSASAYAGDSSRAWYVNFYDGEDGADYKTNDIFPLRLVRNGQSAGTSSAPADCFFNWAEKTYPQYFFPAGGKSQTLGEYYYRQYSGNTYLGVSSKDSHVYYLIGGKMGDAGLVSTWLVTAGCGGGQAAPAANQALSAPTILTAPTSAAAKSLVTITVQAGVDPGGAQVSANCSATQSDHPDSASASLSGLGQGGRSVQHSFTFNAVGTQTIRCTTFDANGKTSPTTSQSITITLQSPAAFVAAMAANPTAAVGELATLAADPANAEWVNEVISAVASGPVATQTALMATTDTKLLDAMFGMLGSNGAVGRMVMKNVIAGSPLMQALTTRVVSKLGGIQQESYKSSMELNFLRAVLSRTEGAVDSTLSVAAVMIGAMRDDFAIALASKCIEMNIGGGYQRNAAVANYLIFKGTGYVMDNSGSLSLPIL